MWRSFIVAVVLTAASVAAAHAQDAAAPALTIGEAMAAAARQHPGTAEAAAQAAAAAEGVNLARAAYLPRLDAMWQVTRASRNNVFGAFFPTLVVPISGPVLGTESFESAWGTATGLLFAAEVFDFGRRAALVTEARAGQQAAEAQADAARLEASVRAADLFLTAAGAAAVVHADSTTVTRLETLQQAVTALVAADLRPGADRARVDADLAAARSRLYADQQTLEVTRIRLAVAVGQADAAPTLDAAPLLAATPGDLPPAAPAAAPVSAPVSASAEASPAATGAPANVAAHPLVRETAARVAVASAARRSAGLAYRPTITLNGSLSARASGALLDGTIDNGQGLWPDVPNWAAGVTVTFPLFDFGVTNARVGQRTAQATAADARQRAAIADVTGALREARVLAAAAQRIAGTVAVRLGSARQSVAQARARYDAGLTGITDVVESDRVLAQAEADAALATLALWRARLALAAASGDLASFVAQAAAPTGPPVPTSPPSPPGQEQ